ncbi:hypothetical protein ACQU0X_08435 [Pseudovibrio ascidiaceicola]|uniref:hypothetical protein n=1 Tax=Pseudovibrio ascidiaceicola TaxID=285279 RepID=UPI003D35EFEA
MFTGPSRIKPVAPAEPRKSEKKVKVSDLVGTLRANIAMERMQRHTTRVAMDAMIKEEMVRSLAHELVKEFWHKLEEEHTPCGVTKFSLEIPVLRNMPLLRKVLGKVADADKRGEQVRAFREIRALVEGVEKKASY